MPADTYNGEWSQEKRDRRQGAAARATQVENALRSSGDSIDSILASLGITNQKEHGMALYNQYGPNGLYSTYGTGAIAGANYDWSGGKRWDPTYITADYAPGGRVNSDSGGTIAGNTGKWVGISGDEYKSRDRNQGYIDKYGEGNFNPWRIEQLAHDQKTGDVNRDKTTGMLYNDPNNDPTQRQYFDEKYQNVSAPGGVRGGSNVGGSIGGSGLGSIYDSIFGTSPLRPKLRGQVRANPAGFKAYDPNKSVNPYQV